MTSRRIINGTCPACRGPLTEIRDGELLEFECLVGHRYSPEALLHAHADTQERSLWSAVVALEEAQNLVNEVGPHLSDVVRSSLESEALQKKRQAGQIRDIIHALTPFRTT